jgi:flavodoxin I
MKALVLYDSTYGNTEALARAMGVALGDAEVVAISDAAPADLGKSDLLIVGSPTQGGRPTAALTAFLGSVPTLGLDGTPVAAFDTRFASNAHGFGLRLLMKVIGFAAPRIARTLKTKGGRLAAPPEGFIVEAKEGPLKPGELERAADWARSLVEGARPLAHSQEPYEQPVEIAR